jgi:hypothetical protein
VQGWLVMDKKATQISNNDDESTESKNILLKFKRNLTIFSYFSINKLEAKFSKALKDISTLDLQSVISKWKNLKEYASIIKSALRYVDLNDNSQSERIQAINFIAEKLKFLRKNCTYDDVSEDEVMGDTFIDEPAFDMDGSDFLIYIYRLENFLDDLRVKFPEIKGNRFFKLLILIYI